MSHLYLLTATIESAATATIRQKIATVAVVHSWTEVEVWVLSFLVSGENMQDCSQNTGPGVKSQRCCHKVLDPGRKQIRGVEISDSGDGDDKMQMRYYDSCYESQDESPFDEPPLSAELDLDRLVDALRKGDPPPARLQRLAEEEDDSAASSLPHDEPRRQRLERRNNKQQLRSRFSQQQKGKKENRRISFADKLVDIVPEEIGVNQQRQYRSASVASYEDETYASFLSFENSLEYFLRGEWIEQDMDDILSPMQMHCRGSKEKGDGEDSKRENSRLGDCLGLVDPTEYSSKPFSVPFKWKEYTTLDSECLDVELCKNEDAAWVRSESRKRRAHSTRSVCSEDDDLEMEEDENSAANSLRDMLPPLESLETLFERLFQGNNAPNKKQTSRMGVDDESMSMYSENSTLANTSVGMRVANATAE